MSDFLEWYNALSRDDWSAYQRSRDPDTCVCDGCYWFEMVGRKQYQDKMDQPVMVRYSTFKKLMAEWKKRCVSMPKQPRKVGNGKHKGQFVGTLTMTPTDPYNEEDMIKAIKGIMSQKTCPVKRYSWYLEYTKQELPHLHFIYETETGGKILPKVFRRYWKIWDEDDPKGNGFRGGYHAPAANTEKYLEYISKDKGRHMTVGFD